MISQFCWGSQLLTAKVSHDHADDFERYRLMIESY